MLTRRRFIEATAATAIATSLQSRAARAQPASYIRNQVDDVAGLGFRPEGIDAIATLFQTMLDQALHPGAQLAVYRHGRLAFELAGGVADPEGHPVTANTLFQIRSTTKALAATVMMRLRDRGRFDYDDPVVKHWPEFGANGKEKITIAHVLSHRAGIPDGPTIAAADMDDRQAIATAIVAMKPLWEPGTANGYHASSFGWVIEELIHRWEGKPLHQILRDEFLDPLEVKDVFLGLPESEFPRMAKMVVEDRVRQNQPARARFSDFINTYEGVRLPLSWVMGVATARGLGQFLSLLAFQGSWNGRTYYSKETQGQAMIAANPEGYVDLRLQHPLRWGMGFILGDTPDIYGSPPHAGAIGHAGGGASVGWADVNHGISVAFLCNRMLNGGSWERYRPIGDAVYAALV